MQHFDGKPALEQADEVLAGRRSTLYARVANMEAVAAAQRQQEAAERAAKNQQLSLRAAEAEAAAQALLDVSSPVTFMLSRAALLRCTVLQHGSTYQTDAGVHLAVHGHC